MIRVEKNIQFRSGTICLPTSKSLSNRALIIRELAGDFLIHNLSDSDDTQNLILNLRSGTETIDVGAAGTNMRFLISLFSIGDKKRTITGSERMLERPVGKLVNALRSIGANISYNKKDGYPPVTVQPAKVAGGNLSIDGSESSQFISSLLMIAPTLQNGLNIEIENGSVSTSYIEMTIELMKYFGIKCEANTNRITVKPQSYTPKEYTVEGDWSAATFWYGFIAASEIGTSLVIENLSLDSLQGDKKTAVHFRELGVETISLSSGIRIEKKNDSKNEIHFDLINQPDLFPALAFTCAALKINAKFTGLQTLNLKESKRINVIVSELNKTGVKSNAGDDYFFIESYGSVPEEITFSTYNDHRIAMAASIYSMTGHAITIENPEVTTKSYPQFWKDLKSIRIANIY
jgi:3-phosphoshikimate 1-carboxyvinyltransferase